MNRSLERTVLVDDTPLAFLHQPDNGVPVLGFRGDPDDRLLMEAVLPLLQARTRLGVQGLKVQGAREHGVGGVRGDKHQPDHGRLVLGFRGGPG